MNEWIEWDAFAEGAEKGPELPESSKVVIKFFSSIDNKIVNTEEEGWRDPVSTWNWGPDDGSEITHYKVVG